MRNITFATKDFAAIHCMPRAHRDAIKEACAKKIKALGLKPTRKDHGIRFDATDLFVFATDYHGNVTKTPIEHTISINDIMRFIDNVEVIRRSRLSRRACKVLCQLYVLTA
jgi:hypothetical protein